MTKQIRFVSSFIILDVKNYPDKQNVIIATTEINGIICMEIFAHQNSVNKKIFMGIDFKLKKGSDNTSNEVILVESFFSVIKIFYDNVLSCKKEYESLEDVFAKTIYNSLPVNINYNFYVNVSKSKIILNKNQASSSFGSLYTEFIMPFDKLHQYGVIKKLIDLNNHVDDRDNVNNLLYDSWKIVNQWVDEYYHPFWCSSFSFNEIKKLKGALFQVVYQHLLNQKEQNITQSDEDNSYDSNGFLYPLGLKKEIFYKLPRHQVQFLIPENLSHCLIKRKKQTFKNNKLFSHNTNYKIESPFFIQQLSLLFVDDRCSYRIKSIDSVSRMDKDFDDCLFHLMMVDFIKDDFNLVGYFFDQVEKNNFQLLAIIFVKIYEFCSAKKAYDILQSIKIEKKESLFFMAMLCKKIVCFFKNYSYRTLEDIDYTKKILAMFYEKEEVEQTYFIGIPRIAFNLLFGNKHEVMIEIDQLSHSMKDNVIIDNIFMLACDIEDIEILEKLFIQHQKVLYPNIHFPGNVTPLYSAAKNKKEKTIRFLAEKFPFMFRSMCAKAVELACEERNDNALQILINLSIQFFFENKFSFCFDLLIYFISYRQQEMVKKSKSFFETSENKAELSEYFCIFDMLNYLFEAREMISYHFNRMAILNPLEQFLDTMNRRWISGYTTPEEIWHDFHFAAKGLNKNPLVDSFLQNNERDLLKNLVFPENVLLNLDHPLMQVMQNKHIKPINLSSRIEFFKSIENHLLALQGISPDAVLFEYQLKSGTEIFLRINLFSHKVTQKAFKYAENIFYEFLMHYLKNQKTSFISFVCYSQYNDVIFNQESIAYYFNFNKINKDNVVFKFFKNRISFGCFIYYPFLLTALINVLSDLNQKKQIAQLVLFFSDFIKSRKICFTEKGQLFLFQNIDFIKQALSSGEYPEECLVVFINLIKFFLGLLNPKENNQQEVDFILSLIPDGFLKNHLYLLFPRLIHIMKHDDLKLVEYIEDVFKQSNSEDVYSLLLLHQNHKELYKIDIARRYSDINKVDNNGNTALHKAAEYDNLSYAMFLLAHGINSELKNKNNKTAWEIAEGTSSSLLNFYPFYKKNPNISISYFINEQMGPNCCSYAMEYVLNAILINTFKRQAFKNKPTLFLSRKRHKSSLFMDSYHEKSIRKMLKEKKATLVGECFLPKKVEEIVNELNFVKGITCKFNNQDEFLDILNTASQYGYLIMYPFCIGDNYLPSMNPNTQSAHWATIVACQKDENGSFILLAYQFSKFYIFPLRDAYVASYNMRKSYSEITYYKLQNESFLKKREWSKNKLGSSGQYLEKTIPMTHLDEFAQHVVVICKRDDPLYKFDRYLAPASTTYSMD